MQVCLIRRKTATQWGIPKGNIDRGHTHTKAALAEAHEEAGLDGRLTGETVGSYEYEKGSVALTVAVYVMEVTDERTTWDEMRWRERRWCSLAEADALLTGHPVWPLYDRIRPTLATRLNTQPTSGMEPETH